MQMLHWKAEGAIEKNKQRASERDEWPCFGVIIVLNGPKCQKRTLQSTIYSRYMQEEEQFDAASEDEYLLTPDQIPSWNISMLTIKRIEPTFQWVVFLDLFVL